MSTIPAQLSARTLRDLGSALIARARAVEQSEATYGRELSPEGVERLAEILAAGSRPSLGFWLRHSTGRSDA
jgi:hypothetical protein